MEELGRHVTRGDRSDEESRPSRECLGGEGEKKVCLNNVGYLRSLPQRSSW